MKSDKSINELDILLKRCLHTKQEPDDILHQKVMEQWKERSDMKKRNHMKAAVAAAAGAVALMTVTAGAAMRFLSPSEVVTEMGNEKLADIFERDNAIAINETQVGKDYSFTLLGIAEGEDLRTVDIDGNAVEENGFYAVVAIANIDGSPLSTEEFQNSETWYVISPLIQGLEPWRYNIATMNGAYCETGIDGVVYRMIDCDQISYFADRELYLCVSDEFCSSDAYHINEETGEITPNEDYEGTNLLFRLPIDKSRADADKAAEYIAQIKDKWEGNNADETDQEEGENDFAVYIDNPAANADYLVYSEAFRIDPEKIHSVLTNMGMEVLDRQTAEAVDGKFHFKQFVEDGIENDIVFFTDSLNDTKWSESWQYSENETEASLTIMVAELNEDGTATCTFYRKDYQNESVE